MPQGFLNLYPNAPTDHLLFIEWFSQIGSEPDPNSRLYKVKKSKQLGTNEYETEIVLLSSVKQSIQLIPIFPKNNSSTIWTSETVLDLCNTFYINNWSSIRTYQCIY